MKQPLVGIAIPSYRAAGTLRQTLVSCLRQTMADFVIVVAVDGDDAEDERRIIAELDDPRIELMTNGRQLGQYWNFNRAMLACYTRGVTWIKPLCADDELLPDSLERLTAHASATPNCGLSYGYYDCIGVDSKLTATVDLSSTPSTSYAAGKFLRAALPLFNPVGGPSSVLLSRAAFERCGGFDDRFPWSGDQILWYRIAQKFAVAVVGERPVLRYREHENTVTSRMGLSANRFSDPVNLGRDISLGAQPPSLEWLLSQHASGQAMGASWVTGAALIRRGLVREGLRGIYHASAQARALWLPFAAEFMVRHLVLRPLGIRRQAALAPPFERPPRRSEPT